jgi:CRISPR type III-A-associated protein Csm2
MAETEQQEKPAEKKPEERKPDEKKPENRGPREGRPNNPQRGGPGGGGPGGGGPGGGGPGGGGGREHGGRGPDREGGRGGEGRRGDERRGDERRGGDRGGPFAPPEIDLEKLISDSLYLDNAAHSVVSRMRDMDSGTKSQLRRFYNAVRRACRTPEGDRQHEFVMLRARLAYTIARHSLRSLDMLEKLLLQVTRKNDARGYERFRDLFEAIVAYNE